MVKKSAVVAAVLTAGLLLGAPFASATEGHHPAPPPKGGGGGDHSVVDNRGCDAGDGILNVSCNPIGVKIGNIL